MTARRKTFIATIACTAAVAAGVVFAQRGGRNRGGNDFYDDDRRGIPDWKNEAAFDKDVFTFVRVMYNSGGGGRGGGYDLFGGGRRRGRGGWGGGWQTDFPDSDLNFSFRLQQLTSLKVNPEPIYLPLTDPQLFDYPFLYMIEPGSLWLSDEEVKALRKYLLNGGFLMVDDFWGDYEWENFYHEIKKVFPEFEPEELPIDHEIFNIVYRLKEKPPLGHYVGRKRRRLSHRSLPRHFRRQRPDDGHRLPQHRPRRRLGTRGRRPLVLHRIRRKESVPDGHQYRRLRDDALRREI